MISTKINKFFSNQEKLKCENDYNCSIIIFTLNSYCCNLNGFCCSWFEYIFHFQSYSNKHSVPFRLPTLLTIITLLIFLVFLIIFNYCLIMLVCYRFKCGLFRKPKLTIITDQYNRFNNDIYTRLILSKKERVLPKFNSENSNQFGKKKKQNLGSNSSMSFRVENSAKSQISKNNISSKLNSNSDRSLCNRFLNNSIENHARNDFLDFSSLDIENSIDDVLSTDLNQCCKSTLNFYPDEKPPSYFEIIGKKN